MYTRLSILKAMRVYSISEFKRREGFKLEELVSSMKLYRKSGKCPLYLVNRVISLLNKQEMAMGLSKAG